MNREWLGGGKEGERGRREGGLKIERDEEGQEMKIAAFVQPPLYENLPRFGSN